MITNRLYIIFVFIALSVYVTAQRKVSTFYDEAKKQPKEVYFVIDHQKLGTVKHGFYTIWYADKKLWQEGLYDYDKLDGKWVDYYDNGILKQELQYDKGLLDGTLKFYYPTGQLMQHAEYKQDKLHGVVINYYEDGKIQETGMADLLQDQQLLQLIQIG